MGWRRRRQIGTTGISVGGYAFGTTAIGGRHVYADVVESEAVVAIHTAYELGVRLFDTAPFYGLGVSEVRLGKALAGLPRQDILLSSKVGRFLVPPAGGIVGDPNAEVKAVFDYSRDGVMRQLDESLERIATDRLDIVFIHDPEWEPERLDAVKGEAFPALAELRDAGRIGAIGIGLGDCEVAADLVKSRDLDIVMIACRYTLADQTAADELLPVCRSRGVSVFLAAPFNSGLLATGTRAGSLRYNHHPAGPDIIAKVARIEAVCDRFAVPLRAAALQFPLRCPAIDTVVAGARGPAEVRDTIAMLELEIPEQLWSSLAEEGLLASPVELSEQPNSGVAS